MPPELFLTTSGTPLTIKFRDFQKYAAWDTAARWQWHLRLPCAVDGHRGTATTPDRLAGQLCHLDKKSRELSPGTGRGTAEQCRESCPAAAGSRAALTGTRRVGRGGQIYPHLHRPRKIQFLVQTWVRVTCEKHRIKPGSGRMNITVAVALLHKTLHLILESNNGQRRERK